MPAKELYRNTDNMMGVIGKINLTTFSCSECVIKFLIKFYSYFYFLSIM